MTIGINPSCEACEVPNGPSEKKEEVYIWETIWSIGHLVGFPGFPSGFGNLTSD